MECDFDKKTVTVSDIGHREQIVTGLQIGAKNVGKPGVVILCKATCDWLIICRKKKHICVQFPDRFKETNVSVCVCWSQKKKW